MRLLTRREHKFIMKSIFCLLCFVYVCVLYFYYHIGDCGAYSVVVVIQSKEELTKMVYGYYDEIALPRLVCVKLDNEY